jgi:beta-galactosidase
MGAKAREPIAMEEAADRILVRGPKFEAHVDRLTGMLSSWRYRGVELIQRGLRPDFWRAWTDNDRGARLHEKLDVWRQASMDWQVESVDARMNEPSSVEVAVRALLPAVASRFTMIYTFSGAGEITVEVAFEPGRSDLPMLPRVGLQMVMPAGFDEIAWFGPGPEETYSDRNEARIGVYRGTVGGQWTEYSKPQENGNKVDVRWVALANRQGIGLMAIGMPLLSVAARHYTHEDMWHARHTYEMARRPEVYVNLDFKQMGVGGDNSWGALPHEPYQLPAQAYRYRFRLQPIGP